MAQVINTSDVALAAITPRTNSVTSGGNVIVPGAKELRLTNTVGFFRVSRDGSVNGTTAATASITFNASRIYLGTGALTWSTSPSVTLTGTGDTRTLTYDNMGANERVVVTASLLDTDGNTYSDSISIAKLLDGSDSLTVVLSNDSCVVPANVLGQTQSYIGTGTTIEVYEGSQKLTYVTGTVNTSNFSVSSVVTPTAKLTVGAVTGANTTTATVANHSGLADDTDLVTVVYTITAKRSNGTQQTLTATQNISKTRAGLNYGDARSLYTDPSFQNGLNSITVYNNAGNGVVTITRGANQTDSPFANSSAFNLAITTSTNTASPGLGGFVQSTTSRSNAIFLQRIVAKIPVGYSIQYDSNPIGDNSSQTWLTSQAGTGQFQEYLILRKCGPTGTFSSTGHIYLTGTTVPVTWYVAYAAMYDFTGPANLLVSARLSRDSVVLSADSSGIVSDFTQATSTFSVYNGSVDDSANWTFSVTPGTGITGTVSNSNRTYAVTALSQDTSTVTFTATRSGYATLTSTFALAKARAGASGSNAAYVVITGDQAFKFLAGSATPTQTSITLSAALYGGLSTYDWEYYDGSVWQNFASNTSQTFTLAYNNAAWGSATTLRIRCLSGVYSDEITVVKLYDGVVGSSPVVGYLTNEAHVLAATSDGTVAAQDYTNAGGIFKVYSGTTEVTNSSTFSIVGTPTGITATINASGVYTLSNMTVNTTAVQFRAVYGTTTIDKIYSVSKSKTGSSGQRGSVTAELATTETSWTQAASDEATGYFTTTYGGAVLNDRITLYNTAGGFTQTRYWSGSSWIQAAAVVDGNLIVTGTVTGDKIAANTITAGKIDTRGLDIKDSTGKIIFSSGGSVTGSSTSNTIQFPVGGSLDSSGNPQAGAVWIILPQPATGTTWPSTMLRFELDIYEYTSGSVQSYVIGGYPYGGNNLWYNTFASYTGDPAKVRRVVFGKDTPTGRPMIALGLFAGSWYYPKITIKNLQVGHSNYEPSKWQTGWDLSFQTSRSYTEHSAIESPKSGGAFSGLDLITGTNVSTYIDNAAIGNAQIGTIIQSTNFNGSFDSSGNVSSVGSAGWVINKNGRAIFNDVVARGDISATSLNAATGTFSGSLVSATGTFSGSLVAATGTFGGILEAGVLDITKLVGQTITYATPGSYTVDTSTLPTGFTSVRIIAIGAGGGGSNSGQTYDDGWAGGAGGGGGGVSIATFSGIPSGTVFTIVVGAGGNGGASRPANGGSNTYSGQSGSSGGNSSVTATTGISVIAYGGGGGTAPTNTGAGSAGGAGGGGTTASGSSGTTQYTQVVPFEYDKDGNVISYTTVFIRGGDGGKSGLNYGSGGLGNTSNRTSTGTGTKGNPGGIYGGGGGGAGLAVNNGSSGGGGDGANGKIILEFFNPNGVVIRSEWNTLLAALASQGISTS